MRLFLLFTLVPLVEVVLLVRIGSWLGTGPTLLLIVGTGAAGAGLARREGLRSWLAVQGELAQGNLPTEQLVHAMMILVAGIVLITPGVITDVVGLLLLVPPVRKGLIVRLRNRFTRQIEQGKITVNTSTTFGQRPFDHVGSRDKHRSGWPAGREILVEDESYPDRSD